MNMLTAATANPREERGRVIAQRGRIKPCGTRFTVPAESKGKSGYTVDPERESCNCPDHELRGVRCKHLFAVSFYVAWQADGTVAEATIKIVRRRTYAQENWPAYNRAQAEEKGRVEALLAALCEGIVEPPYAGGRPGHLLRDEAFAVTHKVYTTLSGRRAHTDLDRCYERGYVSKPLSYNAMFRAIESEALTPVLKAMIDESASVLADFESVFAPDSTGFMTVTYARYYDFKYGGGRKKRTHDAKDDPEPGEPIERRDSIKLHAMVGTKTNVVTHAEVTQAGDAPTMEPLLAATAARFDVKEVVADKGYLSKRNVELIHGVGAQPYIPFKENSSGKGPLLWREMFALFTMRRPEFLQHYHARSNVEAAFSAIKRLFGAAVRSRLAVAQANEVYAKVLCHNLATVVHAMLEHGIEPKFGALTLASKVEAPASKLGADGTF